MKNNTNAVIANPFAFEDVAATESKSRKLDFTPVLQEKARQRATELVKTISTDRLDLAEKANAMMDNGQAQDLLDLIHAIYDDETIQSDAAVLDGCDPDDLPKMLESQRSNRSKAKRAGLRAKLTNTIAYISAMYAELLIREKTGKAYAGQSTVELDAAALAADPDALKRKINSLASKKSRLTKLADYDEKAKAELEATEQQLAELRALRPQPSRTTVKSVTASELRKALSMLNPDEVPAEVLELMKKLG